MWKKLKVLFPEILFIAAVLAALLISMAQHNRSLEAPAATAQGVWWVSAEQEPRLLWEWQSENHFIGQLYKGWEIIDGKKIYHISDHDPMAMVNTEGYPPKDCSNFDWTLGEKAYLERKDVSGCVYVWSQDDADTKHLWEQEGREIEVEGLSSPLYARKIAVSDSYSTYIPIWPEAEQCLWADNRWLHSIIKLEDDRLCAVATRLSTRQDTGRTCQLVSDFFNYQEGDLVLAGKDGLPVVLRPRAGSGFDRWDLELTYEHIPKEAYERRSWVDRDANGYTWVQKSPLTLEDHPALARPYQLDLSKGYRELLYLNDAGQLCLTDLKPHARETVIDDTLTLTETDLAAIRRYGNAITLPLPDGSTRVYFPRTNAFGCTTWLRWDLP